MKLAWFTDIEGIGEWGPGQSLKDFSCFDIFCSPEYLVSKMGSLSPQLATAHKICCDKVGHYAHNFGVLCGKSTPKNDFLDFWYQISRQQLVKKSIFLFFMNYEDILWISSDVQSQIFNFLFFFGNFWPILSQNFPKNHENEQNSAENRPKIVIKNKKIKSGLCTSLDNHEIDPESQL